MGRKRRGFEEEGLNEYGEKEYDLVGGVFVPRDGGGLLDERVLGVRDMGMGGQVSGDATEEMEKLKAYAYSRHSVTGASRVLTMLMKLEEMGLRGNMGAIKEFLDRTVGKVADVQMIAVKKYEGMSDEQLLTRIKELKPKNGKLKGKAGAE